MREKISAVAGALQHRADGSALHSFQVSQRQ